MKRNLIVVRAGNNSLHPGWLGSFEERSWDLVVNYFGDDPSIYKDDQSLRIDSKGPKWVALKQLLQSHPDLIDRYELIWLPDDDLEMGPDDVNRFFEHCRKLALELSQPSLSVDSPTTHPLLINNSLSSVRFTNFVEMMAPCFSSACLRRVLHTFDANQSGWGIDWVWPRFVENRESGMGIVDDVIIRHTRPLGGPNYDAMRAQGQLPTDELVDFWDQNKLGRDRIQIHGVRLLSGKSLSIRGPSFRFTRFLLQGYLKAFIHSHVRLRLMKIVLGLARKPFKVARLATL